VFFAPGRTQAEVDALNEKITRAYDYIKSTSWYKLFLKYGDHETHELGDEPLRTDTEIFDDYIKISTRFGTYLIYERGGEERIFEVRRGFALRR
jgi:hypothetical protein